MIYWFFMISSKSAFTSKASSFSHYEKSFVLRRKSVPNQTSAEDSDDRDSEIQEIFLDAISLIDQGTVLHLDRARSGATPVYYSPNRRSVLKYTRSASSERLGNMERASVLCHEMNLTRITIPSACSYKDFLIEQHVPIDDDTSTPTQIGFYKANRDKFTPVVKELVAFFSRACVGDLVDDEGRVKRDNIPLYLDPLTGEGKVALIDLEEFKVEDSLQFHDVEEAAEEEEEDDGFSALFRGCAVKPAPNSLPSLPINPIVFQILPAHLNEIMVELEKRYPDIEKYRQDFQSVCNRALQVF